MGKNQKKTRARINMKRRCGSCGKIKVIARHKCSGKKKKQNK